MGTAPDFFQKRFARPSDRCGQVWRRRRMPRWLTLRDGCRVSLLSALGLLIRKDFHARQPLEFCFIEYSSRGGRTAAILASLTSTCRRHDVDPQLYLTRLLMNLPTARMN